MKKIVSMLLALTLLLGVFGNAESVFAQESTIQTPKAFAISLAVS